MVLAEQGVEGRVLATDVSRAAVRRTDEARTATASWAG